MLINLLGNYVDFHTCCPEMGIGLPAPRPALRLIGDIDQPKLVNSKDETLDFTEKMLNFSKKILPKMSELDGFIFKKGSPSCGISHVRIYQGPGKVPKQGQGLFSAAFEKNYPLIPIEEEGRLNDARIRENFIERVFVYKRLKMLKQDGITAKKLIDFHTKHKYSLMARNVTAYQRLGQYIAQIDKKRINQDFEQYASDLSSAYKHMATTRKHTNALQHIYGYFKDHLTPIDKQEFLEILNSYHSGHIPLIVPITLIRHYLRHIEQPYIANQFYLNPYPDELMLRNQL
jgi:uncharacterized protein YbgA (DUF1722 family)/uncharacterized protein YbbK (DUF523 family)